MRLQGKVVLVTGAARRVGRCIASVLGEHGARLALHCHRSRREAAALAADITEGFGRDAEVFQADLADARSAARLVDAVGKRFGAIHVLVNNASVYELNRFGRTSPKDWDLHMDVNVRAPFFLSQAAAPWLRQAGGGKIINIGDWAGLRPYVERIPYCVSKAALIALNTVLAKELAPDIQVNAILPGAVLPPDGCPPRRKAAIAAAAPLKRLGAPRDVAEAVVFLIENGDFITGTALPVDGGRLIA
ncbi:MAG: SDR family oxidoreductase [Elusimicrobia bacterium]|nr:SDR family oxidoreductase [Elusimicrobiota bacterium]